jgi:hypothetical protein
LISVGDFGPFSRYTWLLGDTAQNYSAGFNDPDHSARFEKLLKRQTPFDTRLVIVSDSLGGPFTIIDGNHRAVLLLAQSRLVGTRVHLGVHPQIRQFDHAGMAYRSARR